MENATSPSPTRRRLTFGLFKTTKKSKSAELPTVQALDSPHRERSHSSADAEPSPHVEGTRRERSNTLDSPHAVISGSLTVKERRMVKRATVSFGMADLNAELEKQAEEDKASCPTTPKPKSPLEVTHIKPATTKTLARSTSWTNLKKFGSAESLVTMAGVGAASSDGIPVGARAKLEFHRTDSPLSRPSRSRENVMEVGDDLPQELRQRNRVINEIINTERDYVNDLDLMVSVFKTPMVEENLVTKEELAMLFSNVKQLIEVNRMLLADMEKRVKDTNGNELGDSFLFLGDGLKLYGSYCSQHANAAELATKLEKTNNARLRAFFARANAQSNRLSLRDYLIKPVQRICKYPLLLRELIKSTDVQHPDYAKLTSALTKIQSVVTAVNERKEQDDGVEAMAKAVGKIKNMEKFGVQLMVPGRAYLQEGTLLEASKERNEFLPRHYFLFSDLLVLVEGPTSKKGSPKRYEAIAVLPFSENRVNLKMNGVDDGSNSIEIESTTASYVLPFVSVEQKRKWVQSHLLSEERSSSAATASIQRKHSS